MKHRSLPICFFALLTVLVLLCACATDIPSLDTSSTQDTSGNGNENVTPNNENVTYYGKDDLAIHSISQLNTNESEIDSHASVTQYSSLELNYREKTSLGSKDLAGATVPIYSRIRQLPNGEYIMTYQNGQVSSDVYIAFSKDGKTWTGAAPLFTRQEHWWGHGTVMLFMTPDLIVTKDGTVLVVCTFRGDGNNYTDDIDSNGMFVCRSHDNGKTWDDPILIFTGTAWEPCINQLDTGEIQIYFTQTAHTLAIYGFDQSRRSNGTGLLRSYDDGITWTKQDGYSAQIVAQEYIMEHPRNYPCMAAQMPSTIQLHNGSLALAYELEDASGSYKLSVVYSNDNFSKSLGFFEVGPSDMKARFTSGAGPQLVQFHSGETLLSYHTGDLHLALGNSTARTFYDIYDPFDGHSTLWGGSCVDSAHSVLISSANITSKRDDGWALASFLDVARLYLNHQTNAKKSTITVDGKADEWNDNTDAHFIGNETQAQMSIRVSHDDEYVYFLIERLDRALTASDAQGLFIQSSSGGYYLLKFDSEGLDTCSLYNDVRPVNKVIDGMKYHVSVVGTVGDSTKDTGMVLELAIPKSATVVGSDGLYQYNAVLYNKDEENASMVTDYFTFSQNDNISTWQRVVLDK